MCFKRDQTGGRVSHNDSKKKTIRKDVIRNQKKAVGEKLVSKKQLMHQKIKEQQSLNVVNS